MIVDASVLLYAVDENSRFQKRAGEWLRSALNGPSRGDRHAEILGRLILDLELRANLVTDAHLAALAIEHGVGICAADSDFARFPEVRWVNPIAT